MALSTSQYSQIMKSYDRTRLANRDKQLARYEEIYQKFPHYEELDQLTSTLSLKHATSLLSGGDDSLEDYKQQLYEISTQKAAILTEHGYPADYLDTIYSCSDCHDTGHIGNQKCHCLEKAIINTLYTQSNLLERFKIENFETFSFDYYSSNFIDSATGYSSLDIAKAAVKNCRQFVDDFSTLHPNLLIRGNTGVGKTFLCNCIAKELMDQSHSVIYLTASDFFDACAKTAFSRNYDADRLNMDFINCELLIIDDLGTELTNSLTNSQLFIYLNKRILNNKSTLISTNLSLEDIKETYSERIFSRITSNFKILRLAGDDIRIQKKLMKREER